MSETRLRGPVLRSALVLGLIGLATAGAVAASAAHSTASKPCLKGSVAAVVAGKHACLKTGQACKRSLDRQYHRYGFHCHSGRLALATRPTDAFSRTVNVGDHRLFISCRGKGSPTVILEGRGNRSVTTILEYGVGWSSVAWLGIEPALARTTRVCSYDRAGVGQSDARRRLGPVPAATMVEELHALLAGAGISPPYVLGGWSLGGFFNRLYTKRYPGEVVGLVAVDGTPIGLPGEPSWMKPAGQPPIDVIISPGVSSDSLYLAAADAELAAAPDLGARPIVVLTHGRAYGLLDDVEARWLEWQTQVARLSTSSILVRGDFTGIHLPWEAPDLTAEAFRQVIAAVRTGAPLPACAVTPLPLMGGTCLDPSPPGGA